MGRAVRYFRIVLLAGVACLVAPHTASSTSPGELLRSCLEIVSRVEPKAGSEVEIRQTGLSCWSYMSAIQNMSVLETPRGVRLLGICAPPDTTLIDYVRVFAGQARKRNVQSENASGLRSSDSERRVSMQRQNPFSLRWATESLRLL